MRARTRQSGRRGTVLVYFALITFAVMAMAALVIDMGFVRITQAQMQPAVNTAALEGLRNRDDPTIADPATRDKARRQAAADLMAMVYQDYVDPTTGTTVPFGAGPVFALSGGTGAANALETIGPGNPPVYKPSPQLNNSNNTPSGDMVAGTFGTNSSYPSGDPRYENSSYDRRDFTAASASDAPTAPSFLVRLRRTNDFQGLDGVSGVSSHGPTLPLLFGLGSTIAGSSGSGYSVRQNGITARATAIADGRRTLSVGSAYPQTLYNSGTYQFDTTFQGLRGATPFTLNATFWDSMTVGTALTLTVDAGTGLITNPSDGSSAGQMVRVASLGADVTASDGTVSVSSSTGFPTTVPFRIRIEDELLQVVAINGTSWSVTRGLENTQAGDHTTGSVVVQQDALSAGQPLTSTGAEVGIGSTQSPSLTSFTGVTFLVYVPLLDTGSGRVTGFGSVVWTAASSTTMSVAKQASTMASRNASTVVLGKPSVIPSVSPSAPLLAPALVSTR